MNDTDAQVYIWGSGFEQATVSLISSTLESTDLESTDLEITDMGADFIGVIVPKGQELGKYDLTVNVAGYGEDSVPYTVQSPHQVDLRSDSDWLELNPFLVRIDNSNPRMALHVQSYGGITNTIPTSVTVAFQIDAPDGKRLDLGKHIIYDWTPSAIKPTDLLTWTLQGEGMYTITATIDPDNEVEETVEDNNVISRTLTVLPSHPDKVPPTVKDFTIADDIQVTDEVTVTLDVTATDPDTPNASGMNTGSIMFTEFEYLFGAHRWTRIQSSDWVPYLDAHENYTWTLKSNSYGIRYMQAWAADHAGNISDEPGIDVINRPSQEQEGFVDAGEIIFYRIFLEEGQTFSATLTPDSGDPDLYVWGANAEPWVSNKATGEDVLNIKIKLTGSYQIEVHGYSEAEYRLTFGTTTVALDKSSLQLQDSPKPISENPAVSLEDKPIFYGFDVPPTTDFQPEEKMIYLPLISN
jgi:hypothetical protein